MTKEEVLRKVQNQKRNKPDEMAVDILLKSNHVGLIVGLIACLLVMGVKMYFGQPYQDIYAIYSAIFCGQYLYKWFRQKEKFLLFCGILWGFTAVLLFIVYFLMIM